MPKGWNVEAKVWLRGQMRDVKGYVVGPDRSAGIMGNQVDDFEIVGAPEFDYDSLTQAEDEAICEALHADADRQEAEYWAAVEAKELDVRLEGDKNANSVTPEFANAVRHYRSPDDVGMSLSDQFRVIADRLAEDGALTS